MLHDFNDHAFRPPDNGHAVCIAGAGPAGICLALRLAEQGQRVLLLEGGGLDDAGEALQSYDMEQPDTSIRYPGSASRRRLLGGTTAHWGGWSIPLSPADFKPRGLLPGWPMDYAELDHYITAAAKLCEIDPATLAPRPPPSPHTVFKDLTGSGFVNRWFGFSPPTRFGERYRKALVDANNIDLVINANVVGIDENDGLVQALHVRSTSGKELRATAKHFVLATGGIEVPRLLMASAAGRPILGNRSPWMGCGFMDHYGFQPGWLLSDAELSYYRFETRHGPTMPALCLDDSLLQEADLNNFCLLSTPVRADTTLGRHYGSNPLLGLPGKGTARHRLQMICEPTPTEESRISLLQAADVLGLPKVQLEWHIHTHDIEQVNRAVQLIAQRLGMAGLGRFQLSKAFYKEAFQRVTPAFHHMGTTRMAASFADGVVDKNCQVFDTENLFVASSSVFPRAGFANPTINIIALSLRLAEHLEQRLLGGARHAS